MHEGDPWKTTFYHRAVQTRIGRALRERYDLSQPLPDRLAALLMQIDRQDVAADPNAGESREETKADAAGFDDQHFEPAAIPSRKGATGIA
jgi:hypothetical protein